MIVDIILTTIIIAIVILIIIIQIKLKIKIQFFFNQKKINKRKYAPNFSTPIYPQLYHTMIYIYIL